MMRHPDSIFPRAAIPFGLWGTSFFPAWQESVLAMVNMGQFAAEAMLRILGLRKVPVATLEYLVTGSTIPWPEKFWGGPWLASVMDRRIPGRHVEEACATGLQAVIAAAAQVQTGSDVVGVLTFDRTSNGALVALPVGREYRRIEVVVAPWDDFGADPATGGSMISSAGKAARQHRIDRREVDELAMFRYRQYCVARDKGFLQRVAVPLTVLSVQGRELGRIEEDIGVRALDSDTLRSARELDTSVTGLTQTHASDGLACLLVTTREKAAEMSPRPEILIELVGTEEVRTDPGLMPEAPALAANRLLKRLDLQMSDMVVVKTHNPFAVNDVIFAKLTSYDWREMNRTGCSLVYGHPQGPTLTRTLIEALEEAVDIGGGYVMVAGCAAGDVGITAIFRVNDNKKTR